MIQFGLGLFTPLFWIRCLIMTNTPLDLGFGFGFLDRPSPTYRGGSLEVTTFSWGPAHTCTTPLQLLSLQHLKELRVPHFELKLPCKNSIVEKSYERVNSIFGWSFGASQGPQAAYYGNLNWHLNA